MTTRITLREFLVRDSIPARPVSLLGWSCLHCGHQWAGRRAGYQDDAIPKAHQKPRKCPRCYSRYWYRPRRRKVRES